MYESFCVPLYESWCVSLWVVVVCVLYESWCVPLYEITVCVSVWVVVACVLYESWFVSCINRGVCPWMNRGVCPCMSGGVCVPVWVVVCASQYMEGCVLVWVVCVSLYEWCGCGSLYVMVCVPARFPPCIGLCKQLSWEYFLHVLLSPSLLPKNKTMSHFFSLITSSLTRWRRANVGLQSNSRWSLNCKCFVISCLTLH